MVAPIWREWYVMGCLSLNHLGTGFILGYPAILTPAITGNITDIHATRDQASWITAAYGMTGPIGFLILPGLMQMYGRRFINILLNIIILCGFIIIATSPDVATLVFARSLQGIAFGGLYITSILAAEYSQPKRRGFFMVLKLTASSLGVLICHSLGFSLSWRAMAWMASIPPAVAILGTLKWPESPAWLAYKGRYENSAAAFEWLRGSDVKSRIEIRQLIAAQKEVRESEHAKTFLENLLSLRSKEFLKPFLILVILVILLQVCGRHYLLAYLVEIMIQLTGDKSKAFYYTVGLDVMKILAILLSSLVVRLFNRRALLFLTGGVSSVLLALTCIFNYLNKIGTLEILWLTPILLILYAFVCNVGVIPIAIVLKGELFPLKYRGVGTCVIGIIYSLLGMATLKLTSPMLVTLDTYGTFAVYLCITIAALICLYFILPETKDRTMQEIEMNFIDFKFDKDELYEKVTSKLVST